MVLTQHESSGSEEEHPITFPYHYGSYATKYSKSANSSDSPCFHTTMVLTQPSGAIVTASEYSQFPYHYGSYATYLTKEDKESGKEVSIPLWFLRNRVFRQDKCRD